MKKLYELLKEVKTEDILVLIKRDNFVADYLPIYKDILNTLKIIPPRLNSDIITFHKDDGVEYISGIKMDENTHKSEKDVEQKHIKLYSLELFSWQEWLGMSICKNTEKKYSKEYILYKCLLEMTQHGFEDNINFNKEEVLSEIYKYNEQELKKYHLDKEASGRIIHYIKNI